MVSGMALAQGDRERHLLEGDRRAAVVEGAVARSPFLPRHLARLLVALAEQRPRGVVEEHEDTVRVDEKRRRREARHQVAGQNELEGLLVVLVADHQATLPPAPAPACQERPTFWLLACSLYQGPG